MSRLTARAQNGMAYLVGVKNDEQEIEGSYNTLKCVQDAFNRLADYEDAESEGRLISLPCKVGDKVYVVGGYIVLKEANSDEQQ